MRVLFGIILGAVLTVGGAYLYDSHHAAEAVGAPASAQRPLVNWDVVAVKWSHAHHARAQRVEPDRVQVTPRKRSSVASCHRPARACRRAAR